jgi:hypothetical protein
VLINGYQFTSYHQNPNDQHLPRAVRCNHHLVRVNYISRNLPYSIMENEDINADVI